MSQHTPGPWVYEEGTRTIRSHKENYWLASMNSFDGAPDHSANARLIAAAPELFRALQSMVAYHDSKFPENRKAALEMALAALAKAQGGAQ